MPSFSLRYLATHVRDGIDLKRVMITVWLAALPAMFWGMYNLGFQANSAMQEGGVLFKTDWHGWLIGLAAGYDPNSIWDCFWHGACYFLPIYIVTFAVGIAWEILFAAVRGHEVNEGFFVTSILFALTLPPGKRSIPPKAIGSTKMLIASMYSGNSQIALFRCFSSRFSITATWNWRGRNMIASIESTVSHPQLA